jgi:hypothetical protein
VHLPASAVCVHRSFLQTAQGEEKVREAAVFPRAEVSGALGCQVPTWPAPPGPLHPNQAREGRHAKTLFPALETTAGPQTRYPKTSSPVQSTTSTPPTATHERHNRSGPVRSFILPSMLVRCPSAAACVPALVSRYLPTQPGRPREIRPLVRLDLDAPDKTKRRRGALALSFEYDQTTIEHKQAILANRSKRALSVPFHPSIHQTSQPTPPTYSLRHSCPSPLPESLINFRADLADR